MYSVCLLFPLRGINDSLLIILEYGRPDLHDAFQGPWVVYVINQIRLVRELLK
jgi:hypothetical protein